MGIWEYILQLLFPPRCFFCDGILEIGKDCPDCAGIAAKYKIGGDERVRLAARREIGNVNLVCCSYFYAHAVAEGVQRFKFNKKYDLHAPMSTAMETDIHEIFDVANIDVVTGVPSYRSLRRHAGILAESVARRLALPCDNQLLIKIRRTRRQHDLEWDERIRNVQKTFCLRHGRSVKNKTVLVIDDVLTSGHTVNECATALRQAGAARIYVATFSLASKNIGKSVGQS